MSLRACFRRTATPLSWHSRVGTTIMPLRAKVCNPALVANQKKFSTDAFKEQAGDEPDDVLFASQYGLRTVELNRPKKLNSLNGSMIRKILPRLQEWSKSQLANVVVVKGAGRAFCAGGDVAALAKLNAEGPEGQKKSADYFALEYQLDHYIATYMKPYIAFMDGITMGGGVGLSVHAPFRIATENTIFAMPETTIGFFPDVGASFFLPRMEGQLGTYLALTSAQLKGVDAFYHGVATHYLHSSSLPDLEARLGELMFKDYFSLKERYQLINSTIEEFASGLPSDRPSISGKIRRAIDESFSPDQQSVPEILDRLRQYQKGDDAEVSEWAANTIDTIEQRSPTSVAVTLREMRLGREWNIAEAFRHEHRIATQFMAHPDFVEGVTARLVRKEKGRPNWQPNTLAEVTGEQIEAFFAGEPTLELLASNQRAVYHAYPHAEFGLPTERDVLAAIRDGDLTREKLLARFLQEHDGKQGVREKVSEILDRRCRTDDEGILEVV